jgi:hypothetical protein
MILVGDTGVQFMAGDSKALMDKIRDQSLQIEELMQKNELFNKQIENLRRNRPVSQDFNTFDLSKLFERNKY